MTGSRTVTLAMGGRGGMGGMAFTIDGKLFDESRIDIEIAHDALEEWTLVNTSTMDHPFHLHVWPMQLVQVAGVGVTERTTVTSFPFPPAPARWFGSPSRVCGQDRLPLPHPRP